MALLDRIAEVLAQRHAIDGGIRVSKRNASVPVSAKDAEHLASRCGAIITAIGD